MRTLYNSEPGRYTKLSGRVAQILNARELVIAIGADQGVERGMIFAVLAEEPLAIHDPQSNEVLDTIDREKVRVKAIEVRPKVTICSTYRSQEVVTPGILGSSFASSSLSGLSNTPLWTKSEVFEETLRASDSSLPPPLPVEESYVKPNDRVIQIDETPA
jgi:hypothetical protein